MKQLHRAQSSITPHIILPADRRPSWRKELFIVAIFFVIIVVITINIPLIIFGEIPARKRWKGLQLRRPHFHRRNRLHDPAATVLHISGGLLINLSRSSQSPKIKKFGAGGGGGSVFVNSIRSVNIRRIQPEIISSRGLIGSRDLSVPLSKV